MVTISTEFLFIRGGVPDIDSLTAGLPATTELPVCCKLILSIECMSNTVIVPPSLSSSFVNVPISILTLPTLRRFIGLKLNAIFLFSCF